MNSAFFDSFQKKGWVKNQDKFENGPACFVLQAFTFKIEINLLYIKRESRNKGFAWSSMQDITSAADDGSVLLLLRAQPVDLITDKNRLLKLYQRFDFIPQGSDKSGMLLMSRRPR